MRRTLLIGAILALFAFLLIDHGGHLGLSDTFMVLLGASLGAVVGLVPDQSPLLRAAAFVIGFAVAVLGYALRAGVLPDIPMGHAVAAAAVVVVVTLVAAGSGNRLPLWTQLVGVAAFVGAYETLYTQTPTAFLSQWLPAGTTVLLAAAFGFLGASLATEIGRPTETHEARPEAGQRPVEPQPKYPPQRAGIEIVTEPKTEA